VLIAQLQIDLPVYSESIHADRLPHIAQYAMIPAALLAAETVELPRFAPASWPERFPPGAWSFPQDVDAAALIGQWWQTYQETRPPLARRPRGARPDVWLTRC